MGKSKDRRTSTRATDQGDKEFVPFDLCHNNRSACRAGRRWAIGILVVVLVPAVLAAVGFSFRAHGKSSSVATSVEANEKSIDDVETRLDKDIASINSDISAMRQDNSDHQQAMIVQVTKMQALLESHVTTTLHGGP